MKIYKTNIAKLSPHDIKYKNTIVWKQLQEIFGEDCVTHTGWGNVIVYPPSDSYITKFLVYSGVSLTFTDITSLINGEEVIE